MPDPRAREKEMYGYSDAIRFLIQWDNASKRFPFCVLTVSGTCLGYFKTMADAVAFVEG